MGGSDAENDEGVVKTLVKVEKRNRQRFEKRSKKLVYLDSEFGKQIVKCQSDTLDIFNCWRCQEEKTSKNKFNWMTSQGTKVICNGCNGNLLAKRPKTVKTSKVSEDAEAQETANDDKSEHENEPERASKKLKVVKSDDREAEESDAPVEKKPSKKPKPSKEKKRSIE